MIKVTRQFLHDHFEYKDGDLFWKKPLSNRVKVGQKAGTLKDNGYLVTRIDGNMMRNHKIVYMLFNDEIPELIDHIDGNKLNNRIENLRLASKIENAQNSKLRSDNSTGVKGLRWHSQRNKWNVRLVINKKEKSFGLFEDFELAELVAFEAREKYHGQFARHK